jgi:hypothetical protein
VLPHVEEEEEVEVTLDRGRKRRPVRGGLLEQLERALEWGRSGEALRRHQEGGAETGRGVLVRSVGQVGECVVVRGEGEVVLLHRGACGALPVTGQRLGYRPPFCRLEASLLGPSFSWHIQY